MADSPITTEEMDALMEAVQEMPVTARPGKSESRKVKVYDFANPNKFSKEQLRALEMIYTSCARGMTTQLSTLMRAPIEVDPDTILETSYQDFFDTIPNPATIALLNIDPLIGRGILECDPSLSFSLVDRLLGGPGRSLTKLRELTEIEKGLMRRVIDRVIKCLTDAWSTVVVLKPELDMIINSTLFSQVALPDDRVMLASFDIKFGSITGKMHFGMPTTALDPVLTKLSAQQWFSAGHRTANEALSLSIRNSLTKTHLDLSVELGRAEILVRELLELQVGDLICLDSKAGDDLDVMVDSQIKFRGQPGQMGRRLGLKITEVVQGEE